MARKGFREVKIPENFLLLFSFQICVIHLFITIDTLKYNAACG